MTEPAFDFSAPQEPARRPILGWVAVLVILALLTMQQFDGYMNRSIPTEAPSISELDGRLRTIVKGTAFESGMMEEAGVSSEEKEGDPVDETADKQLESLGKQIEPHRKTEETYALFYTIVQFERGLEPEESDLAALEKSGTPRRAAAAKIYGAENMTLNELKNWTKPFNSKLFVDKLVKIHAHEKAGDKEFRRKSLQKGAVANKLVLGAFGMAFLIGCLLLVVYLIVRGMGNWTPMGHPAGALSHEQADGAAMRTALMMVGLFGGSLVIALLLGKSGVRDEVQTLLVFTIALAFAYYVIRSSIHGFRMTLDQIGLHKRDFGANVLWGIGGALANLPILLVFGFLGSLLTRWFPPAHHPVQDEIAGASPTMLVVLLIGGAVFAPVFEEIVFRGTFLPALARKFGSPTMGIVMCGICFAIIHPTGVPAWPPLAALGMMMAHLTYQRKSLVPAITMHAVHNGALLAFNLIALS